MRVFLLFILFILCFSFFYEKELYVFKEIKINNEIYFVNSKENNFVFINNDLIVIKNNSNLENILKKLNLNNIENIYTITNNVVSIFNKTSTIKNNYKYVFNNISLCINNYDCNYVYLLSNKIKINNKIEAIIINEENILNLNTKELIYENWIDILNVENNTYTKMIITNDNFVTFNVGKIT